MQAVRMRIRGWPLLSAHKITNVPLWCEAVDTSRVTAWAIRDTRLLRFRYVAWTFMTGRDDRRTKRPTSRLKEK
jgi:hypothetical protein